MFEIEMLKNLYIKNKEKLDKNYVDGIYCNGLDDFLHLLEKEINRPVTDEEQIWIFDNFDPVVLGLV